MKTMQFLTIIFILSSSAGALHSQEQTQGDEDFATCVRLFEKNAQIGQMDDSTKANAENKYKETEDKQESQTPLGTGAATPPMSTEVSLFTGEEGGRGVISYSRKTSESSGWINEGALKASVPFDKNQGEAIFGSLDGLSGDYVVSGSFSHSGWDIEPKKYGDALCQACRDSKVPLLECNLEGLRARGMTPADANKIEDALFGKVTSKFWGGEGSFGRRERSFFTPDAKKDAEDRSGYSLALFGGLRGDAWSLNGRVTGKRDYKEGNKVNLCSPVGGSGLESCNALPLGEAKTVESTVATLEARYFLGKFNDNGEDKFKFAIGPSAQYDFEEDIWGLELPIYLARNQKGAFTGGVKLGWRSDESDLTLAVFVARDFDLEP